MVKRAVHHSPVWLVVPLWALFVGVVLARVLILIHAHHEFMTHARVTQGIVLRKVERPLDRFSNQKLYALRYTYTAGGIQGTIISQVERETYDRVKVGGPVPVLYLPESPRQHLLDFPLEIAAEAWAPLDDFVVAMLVFVPGVFLIIHFGRRNRIHARLLASGSHAWGQVMALKKTHTRHGSHTYLVFQFATAAGRTIEGRSPSLSDRTHWQEGDPIQVMYDAKRPELFAVDLLHPLDLLDDEPVPRFYQTMWA